jgi:transcriptional regulator with XRE-family HTH domain
MEAERRDGATPASLTAVIAERMKALRGDVRLSGPALAVEMNKQGVPWNRTTVAKLETGRRESVTVPELVALALVLNVPVTALLVAERSSSIKLAEGHEYSPTEALLWLIAERPLPGSPGAERHIVPENIVMEYGPWVTAARPARLARKLLAAHDAALGARERLTTAMERDYEPEIKKSEAIYANRLQDLAAVLTWLNEDKMTPLPVDERLRHDATQRGIELPPVEQED